MLSQIRKISRPLYTSNKEASHSFRTICQTCVRIKRRRLPWLGCAVQAYKVRTFAGAWEKNFVQMPFLTPSMTHMGAEPRFAGCISAALTTEPRLLLILTTCAEEYSSSNYCGEGALTYVSWPWRTRSSADADNRLDAFISGQSSPCHKWRHTYLTTYGTWHWVDTR